MLILPGGNLAAALPPIDLHWAIEARWAQNALSMLEKIGWQAHRMEVEAYSAGPGEKPDAKPFQFEDGVAILGLSGPMTKRPQSWGSGTSTVQMRRLVRQAANDPDVRQIALVIDSPGGQLSGTHELAQDVREANKRKPVTAYIEDLGASAAYWVASQAGKIYANEPGFVGSIGAYLVVEDYSKAAEGLGVKVHVVKAGEFKGAGYPGTPVTDAQLEDWQRQVNRANDTFLQSVSRGRNWPIARTREIADGRVHVGKDALALGLIDGIRTFDSVLQELRAEARGEAAKSSGREEETMSRMDSFLAWLKGEGGEDVKTEEQEQKTEQKPAVPASPPTTAGISEERFNAEKSAREKAEAQAGKILSDVKPEIIKAGIRAGMPPKLVESTVETLAKNQDWDGLKPFWDDAKAATDRTIKPGTSADRGAATQDDANPDVLRTRYREEAKEIVGRVVPANGKGRS
jgi:signal peptide peptidase SppA